MIGSQNYVYHWLRLQSIGITHISFRPWRNINYIDDYDLHGQSESSDHLSSRV